jgi:N-acetyl-anhydromuramyl-L-alanine amidase AmpD
MARIFDAQGWYTKAVNYNSKEWRTAHKFDGYKGRIGVCMHITDGVDSRAELTTSPRNVSSTFLIREEGVYQLVSVFDSPWSNGIWEKGHSWKGVPDSENPNEWLISIEREGRPFKPVSAHMDDLTVSLLADLTTVFPHFSPYVAHVNLIGHNEISPFHRPNCPSPATNLQVLAQKANTMTPNAPQNDFKTLWGTQVPVVWEWGVPSFYRSLVASGTLPGKAVSDEEYTHVAPELVLQRFEHGAIVYNTKSNQGVWVAL